MRVPRSTAALARRGRAVPVPPGGVLGTQQQRVPQERGPAVPRRGQPPRVRDAGVRQRPRPRHPRQGRGAHPRRAAGRGRAAAARGGDRRRHPPVQEQHRLGRQLVRLSRELPGRPARRVQPPRRRPRAVPGHPSDHLRGGQGAADAARRGLLREPACRAHLGVGVQRDDPVPSDHQHPRRAACRRRAVPPAARHRRRLEHERDDDAPQGRDDRHRAAHDRVGRRHAGHDAGEPDPRHPRGQPRHDRPAPGQAGQRPGGQRPGDPAGVSREGGRLRLPARRRLGRRPRPGVCGDAR